MCGRFTLRATTKFLIEHFQLATAPQLALRFNITPPQPVAVVRRAERENRRELVLLRWGLVPAWVNNPASGSRMINARAETVAEKPSFRAAFKRRRCLVPADGYYEWQTSGGKKQPYLIRPHQERPFAFAGLWERWEGTASDGENGSIESCTIITTEANQLTRPIHDRMPVILDPADYERWLDPAIEDANQLHPLLCPYQSNQLIAERVSTHVNNPRHDDPECVRVQRELFC